MDPKQKIIDQLAAFELQVDSLDTSGKLQRVAVVGDKGRKKSGWYVLHEYRTSGAGLVIVGRYGNWKISDQPQKIEPGAELSEVDRQALADKRRADQEKIRQERQRAAEAAAKRAAELWQKLRDTGNTDYLKNKGVRGYGVRYSRGALVVPVYNIMRDLVGLQFIQADGEKKFITGTPVEGGFHCIDAEQPGSNKIVIAEGYATAASLREALGWQMLVVFHAGNILPVARAYRKAFPDVEIIIAADDDHETIIRGELVNVGKIKALAAAAVVNARVVFPSFISPAEKSDFNDMHQEQGLDAVRNCVQAQLPVVADALPGEPIDEQIPIDAYEAEPAQQAAPDEWKQELQRNKDGKLLGNLSNVYLLFTHHDAWQGVICRDEFSARIICKKRAPFGGEENRPWSDTDDSRAADWLSRKVGCTAQTKTVAEAVQMVAEDNAFHPVRDYLDSITWDGKSRIYSWMIDCLGAASAPGKDCTQDEYAEHKTLTEYVQLVSAKWLISAVARVFQPGCKVDTVLILEGLQGKGKSTAFNILAGEWFSDTPFSLGTKEAFESIRGKWIIEMAELDAFNKTEATRAKAFFSSSSDNYRESYGRRNKDFPRQCVFGGSTNQHEYLRDATGNRRYWPVNCTEVDVQALRDCRDQLWSEALMLYRKGIKWWPEGDEVKLFDYEQTKRQIDDPWVSMIYEWLEDPVRRLPDFKVTVPDILTGCLKFDNNRTDEKAQSIRVGKCLAQLGMVRRQRRKGLTRYYYVRGVDYVSLQ